jgi:hypothetical protein
VVAKLQGCVIVQLCNYAVANTRTYK